MPFYKRRRGRPRRGEVRPVDEFDLILAREFQQRPAFYDRSHPQYRNRDYLEPLWHEIAESVGQNVGIVKTRMVQLRNRYNLEKRRLEGLQEQYHDPDITSGWPMYEHLSYLGDHIKARRSGMKLPLLTPKQQPASSDSEDCDDAYQYQAPNTSTIRKSRRQEERQQNLARIPVEASRSVPNNYNHHQSDNNSDSFNESSMINETEDSNETACKFKAFGKFLSSSLIEMEKNDALRLVEKFTTDMVKSLLLEHKSSHQTGDIVENNLLNGHE